MPFVKIEYWIVNLLGIDRETVFSAILAILERGVSHDPLKLNISIRERMDPLQEDSSSFSNRMLGIFSSLTFSLSSQPPGMGLRVSYV